MILDIDDTLINTINEKKHYPHIDHSKIITGVSNNRSNQVNTFRFIVRPYLDKFLIEASKAFEIIVFTYLVIYFWSKKICRGNSSSDRSRKKVH